MHNVPFNALSNSMESLETYYGYCIKVSDTLLISLEAQQCQKDKLQKNHITCGVHPFLFPLATIQPNLALSPFCPSHNLLVLSSCDFPMTILFNGWPLQGYSRACTVLLFSTFYTLNASYQGFKALVRIAVKFTWKADIFLGMLAFWKRHGGKPCLQSGSN